MFLECDSGDHYTQVWEERKWWCVHPGLKLVDRVNPIPKQRVPVAPKKDDLPPLKIQNTVDKTNNMRSRETLDRQHSSSCSGPSMKLSLLC